MEQALIEVPTLSKSSFEDSTLSQTLSIISSIVLLSMKLFDAWLLDDHEICKCFLGFNSYNCVILELGTCTVFFLTYYHDLTWLILVS